MSCWDSYDAGGRIYNTDLCNGALGDCKSPCGCHIGFDPSLGMMFADALGVNKKSWNSVPIRWSNPCLFERKRLRRGRYHCGLHRPRRSTIFNHQTRQNWAKPRIWLSPSITGFCTSSWTSDLQAAQRMTAEVHKIVHGGEWRSEVALFTCGAVVYPTAMKYCIMGTEYWYRHSQSTRSSLQRD